MAGTEQDLVSERHRVTPVRAKNASSLQKQLVILQEGSSMSYTEL